MDQPSLRHEERYNTVIVKARPHPQHSLTARTLSTQDSDSSSSSTMTMRQRSSSILPCNSDTVAVLDDDDADADTDTPIHRGQRSNGQLLSTSPPDRDSNLTPRPGMPQTRSRRRQTRRYFTPPSRHRSPVRPPMQDLNLSVETMPQDPDIFADPETDYFSMAEGAREEFAQNLTRRLKFVDALSSQSMNAVLSASGSRVMPGGLMDLDFGLDLDLGRSRFS